MFLIWLAVNHPLERFQINVSSTTTFRMPTVTLKYRFVVIFLPLMNLVDVETDLKLPIPPPPPPKDEEEKEVTPPPMSPNEVKPTDSKTKQKTSSFIKPGQPSQHQHVALFVGMDVPESNPEKLEPNPGKPPKPNSDPPILLRLAPLWWLRLPPKKSSKGSSAVEANGTN